MEQFGFLLLGLGFFIYEKIKSQAINFKLGCNSAFYMMELFIVHQDSLEPGRPGYGRAHRYDQIHLEASPTDDYSDVEHYSFGWLTDLDGEQQFESEDEEEPEVEDD